MKRAKLIKAIQALGWRFTREGGNHTIYRKEGRDDEIAIPRHNEVNEITAKKILKQAK